MPDRPRPETRSLCGYALQRQWWVCPSCARAQVWRDDQRLTGAECAACGWVVSDKASFCPWCGEFLLLDDYVRSLRGWT